jgi:plasmid stability protein
MAVLHIRNVPDALYRQAQLAAAVRGVTLGAYVISLMQADLARAEAGARGLAALARIRHNLTRRQRAIAGAQPSAADLVRTGRADRERELLHG